MTGTTGSSETPQPPRKPIKQKMAASLKSFGSWVIGGAGGNGNGAGHPAPMGELFAKTDPATDGEECLHDCETCAVRYPRGFKIEEEDALYGEVKAWSTHLIVGTGKADWVRDVADEKGSVMEAVDKAGPPSNGKMKLSASNMPTPHDTSDYSEPATVLLLPAFTLIDNVRPANVPTLITDIVSHAPTTATPLHPTSSIPASVGDLSTRRCPHNAVILMCSQGTRDARCGQSAPLLRRELERHLRPLGLYRDLHDERPGGVGIYFISHVGGHKYSANVMVYRRPNAFGQDDVAGGGGGQEEGEKEEEEEGGGEKGGRSGDVGAAQCIWLARIKPEDCENLVRYTVLKGKVVKPESQLRGGFDRAKGLMSW
ncbi:Actin patches distal protein-like protein [Hapsidospora chrysogenum ATCC 11550]|uniref:Actin patches distal protein-like protein n=1 Tax=Hapsidospora chrysogenum (strain ATCC 11550 / CBS 779.69 / DSM 880 / IAM 14645 / JCM 23072 / IMI 49137) TaxID=857340 RepID=A0A086SVV9_HAPC1|nr:Actin patches distal protein-like protein [Hapsidospora chrysogenum ATCC 11550]